MVYEVTGITTPNLSSTVQQVGTYTIPVAGKYQIRLMGEAGGEHNNWNGTWSGAGGILIANTYYDADISITLKGIKGWKDSSYRGGAGVALWDTINTTGVPTLVAGGGPIWSGGGYIGGSATGSQSSVSKGYSWDGSLGTNTTYCNSATCNIGATGGRSRHGGASGYYTYGGTGTGASGYPCPSDYTCTTVTGGNGLSLNDYANYPASTYGNWGTNTLTGGAGYAAIVYCGPNANSACPASCGNDVACTTGTCNYRTGLCE